MEDIGSGGRCREVSESADAVDDQLGPAGSVAEVDWAVSSFVDRCFVGQAAAAV